MEKINPMTNKPFPDCTPLTEAQKTKDPWIETHFTVGLKRIIYAQQDEIAVLQNQDQILKDLVQSLVDKILKLEERIKKLEDIKL